MSRSLFGFLLLSAARLAQALSYEGFLDNRLPVWMDLNVPSGEGTVTGTYFYKRVGGEIPLSGKAVGRSLRLGESDRRKRETAAFTMTDYGDSLIGSWKKAGGRDSLPVRLQKTDPAHRKRARIPKPENLILTDGKTLAEELDGWLDAEAPDKRNRFELDVRFARNDILGMSYFYEAMGAYPVEGTVYHTFDLDTRKEIDIRKEIDPKRFPAFNAYFAGIMLPRMPSCRNDRSDSEWAEAFPGRLSDYADKRELKKAIDTIFSVANLPDDADYYFIGDSLIVQIWHYFGFPHVIQAMDCTFDMSMPLPEFGTYLRKGSPLRRITSP